mgnify:CR=1 FL=1
MHSKPKLALAILTSPTAAFEEILSRRLLGTAVAIVALTGLVAAVPALVYGLGRDPIKLFLLGKQNPLCWPGLCMLYALLIRLLLKWVGSQSEYVAVVTVMGWAQISLLLAQIAIAAASVAEVLMGQSAASVSFLGSISLALHLWYVVLAGMGIRATSQATLARGIMSYVVIELAVVIAASITYGSAWLGGFERALPGIKSAAGMVVAADQSPWLAAGVIGLVLGLWRLGKELGWGTGAAMRAATSAGLVGAAALAVYIYSLADAGYIGRLADAQRLCNRKDYAQAAMRLETLLPVLRTNQELMIDLGDLHFLAGNASRSIRYYNNALTALEGAPRQDANMWRARVRASIGAVYDFAGRHEAALREFRAAAKAWPEYREAWVRQAITYDRMGNYEQAIEKANHAVRQLDSEAVVAWVALAEAFANTGDTKQAKAAIAMVTGENKNLAKRIGTSIDDWKSAVSKLTRGDLKFPLENQPAPVPKKGTK